MKRIAIATDGNEVSQHFGFCEEFSLYDVENNEVVKKSSLTNPEHKPGFLPNHLSENDVDVIISGGMGAKATDLFNEKGIEVIVGVTGKVSDAVEKYLNDELVSSGSVCSEHAHSHECGKH